MSLKLAIVVGATGGQGGSVVTALLKNPETYKVRGITRNASSEAANALATKGVEVVTADLNDLESLNRAFEGASLIFGITNFFDTFYSDSAEKSMEIEYTQGTNMAKAASRTESLEHFVWSTLPDSEKLSNGKFMVPHFQGKSRIDEFIRQDEKLLKKTTFMFVSFYAANLFYPPFTPNLLKSSGKYISALPMPPSTRVSFISDHSVNIGTFAKAIFDNPGKTLGGKYVNATTDTMQYDEALKLWGKVSGKNETAVIEVSLEAYQALFGEKWGLEMGLMCQFWAMAGDRGWDSPQGKPLTGSDLGLGTKELVMLEDAWKATDWSSL